MDSAKPDPELYGLPFTFDSFNGMPYRCFGNTGLRVSAIGLGTWKFGYPETGDGSRTGEKEALKILDKAVDEGVTFWDTANRYNSSSGNSERIIGKWLSANSGSRRDVVIATKCFGAMDGRTPNHCRLGRSNILGSVYASLKRLRADYVDVLYFHSFDKSTPADESLAAVDDLVRRDLVRYFAVSNFTVENLRLYRELEKEFGSRVRVAAVQNRYDVLSGEKPGFSGVLDFCAETGMAFVPYSPLARGLLTDRYLDPKKAGRGDRLYDEGTLQRDTTPETLEKLHKISELAAGAGMSVSAMVLSFMLTIPGMGVLIPTSSTVEQLLDNASAGKVKPDDDLRQAFNRILT